MKPLRLVPSRPPSRFSTGVGVYLAAVLLATIAVVVTVGAFAIVRWAIEAWL